MLVNAGGGYDRNAARMIQREVGREHGRSVADGLICELDPTSGSGLTPGAEYANVV